jgi:hypothetical protein
MSNNNACPNWVSVKAKAREKAGKVALTWCFCADVVRWMH